MVRDSTIVAIMEANLDIGCDRLIAWASAAYQQVEPGQTLHWEYIHEGRVPGEWVYVKPGIRAVFREAMKC